MKHTKYIGELGGANFDKKLLMVALIASLLVNLGLTASLLTKKDIFTTTFIPPELNQAFTLTDGNYSNAYVEQVSTWFLAQTLNYTPASFEYQMNTFLKHVDPALFSKLRQTLLVEFDDIKKQRRSSTFFTQKVRVKGLSALITGVRQIKVGSTEASLDKEHWYIQLTKRRDGLVTLADFKQVSETDANSFVVNQ